ncbi:MAG: hypothetical protein WBA74_13280 [Cyclobacteriaceae bacterium]
MKVPSLVRLPKYKSFAYEPRHYDPIREEIKERTYRIKKELEAANKIDKTEDEKEFQRKYSSSISFKRQESKSHKATLIQMAIAAILASLAVGWLFYGDRVLYSLLLIFPVYIYFRFKGRFGKRK